LTVHKSVASVIAGFTFWLFWRSTISAEKLRQLAIGYQY